MGEMVRTAYLALDIIRNSVRYKNMTFSNFINLKTENTQFGAVTVRMSGKTIVSFKGTDSSIIGWIENFRVTYSYPTFTHNLAIEYLKTNALRTHIRLPLLLLRLLPEQQLMKPLPVLMKLLRQFLSVLCL